MDYKEKYRLWLNNETFDEYTKNELLDIWDNNDEIMDRFYKDMEFGTGGLRGIIGAGTNRINKYTIGKATQGFADYILENAKKSDALLGVAIAYDSRNMSYEFANIATSILCANGIKTYMFDKIRPTPELSFTIKHLNLIAGIMITASHNPPEYNGYKVYWQDGSQVSYDRETEVINKINGVKDYSMIKTMDIQKAKERGLYNVIGYEIDRVFYDTVKSVIQNHNIVNKHAKDINIVYTPFNGTGNIPVRQVLGENGFCNVTVVSEQENPDPMFTTVGYPNPEDPKSFKLAIELAKKVKADIIIGTDPDADRMGLIVRDKNGEYIFLTGNMIGILFTDYILSQKSIKNELPQNAAIVKTIVSTKMIDAIAMSYGAEVFDVLTGFKYIGKMINQFEETKSNSYIFGFEESHGFLPGIYSGDKDSVGSSLLMCEMAAYYKNKKMTLCDRLDELYKEYGYFKDSVKSILLAGPDGKEKIAKIMKFLRENPIYEIEGKKTVCINDFEKGEKTNLISNTKEILEYPQSDVLQFILSDKSWVCIRPSGTEPKVKIYMGSVSESLAQSEESIRRIENHICSIIEKI